MLSSKRPCSWQRAQIGLIRVSLYGPFSNHVKERNKGLVSSSLILAPQFVAARWRRDLALAPMISMKANFQAPSAIPVYGLTRPDVIPLSFFLITLFCIAC